MSGRFNESEAEYFCFYCTTEYREKIIQALMC